MKRLSFLLFSLIAMSSVGHAYDFEQDGICYSFISGSDSTVMVMPKGEDGYPDLSGAVVIPATVTHNGKDYTVTEIGARAFMFCAAITSVTFPNTLTTISSYAFAECEGLTHVEFPESLKYIYAGAFYNCTGLQGDLVIPGNIEFLDGAVFFGCNGIKTVYFYAEELSSETSFPSSVEHFIFGDNVRVIPPSCCAGLNKLTSITIPRLVTSIGNNAFLNCDSIKDVTWNAIDLNVSLIGYNNLPPSANIEQLRFGDEVESIPYRIAAGSRITTVTFPVTLKEIDSEAFKDCKQLKSIHIPASTTFMFFGEHGSFRGCSGLTEISVDPNNTKYDSRNNCNAIINTQANGLELGCCNSFIPKELTYIGSYAFEGCSELTGIQFPDSLISIGVKAFYGCTGLTEVSFPNTVISIGQLAFAYCNNISKMTVLANYPPQILGDNYDMYNGTFYAVNSSIPLYVPAGARLRYRAASGWQYFSNIIEIEPTGEPMNQYDVNCDGQVDISDVNAVINAMLGKE